MKIDKTSSKFDDFQGGFIDFHIDILRRCRTQKNSFLHAKLHVKLHSCAGDEKDNKTQTIPVTHYPFNNSCHPTSNQIHIFCLLNNDDPSSNEKTNWKTKYEAGVIARDNEFNLFDS